MPGRHRFRVNGPVVALTPLTTGDDQSTVVLRLYDAVDSWGGDWGVSAKEFTAVLDALPAATQTIELHINSPGGEIYEAIAISNALRDHPARIVAVVDALAASAASFLAMAADEIVMGRYSEMMIHTALGAAYGNSATLRATATELDRFNANMASIYADRAGGTVDNWLTAMAAETWYSADEAVAAGLADRVADLPRRPDAKPTARFDLSIYAHRARADAPPPFIPTTPTRRRQAVAFTDEQISTIRQRLGVADDADEATILAALDEALEEGAAETPTVAQSLPPGIVAIDAQQLAEIRAAAEDGRAARQEQQRAADERTVDQAIATGRIDVSRRRAWLARIAADPGEKTVLESLEPGLVPLTEIGHDNGTEIDREYAALFGEDA